MLEWPEEILAVVDEMVSLYGDNIELATQESLTRISAFPEFEELKQKLIYRAVQTLVWSSRTKSNHSLKRQIGRYHTKSKVSATESASVRSVYKSCYSYFIAGKQLGSMTRLELENTAVKMRNISKEYEFDARICERLCAVVPENGSVRDCIPEKKLRKMFSEVRKEMMATA